ncbi:hypothetical protein ACQ4PT_042415 [Festuca glaucescens]
MEDRVAERRVGDYMLLRQIGSGAYSRVWLGRHLARGTEVAVKEIAMERLSSKLRDSLLSEVDILRSIRHPNVIALHDSIRVVPSPCSPRYLWRSRFRSVSPGYCPVARRIGGSGFDLGRGRFLGSSTRTQAKDSPELISLSDGGMI